MLPTTEWVSVFGVFRYMTLILCFVVLIAMGLAVKRFFDSREFRDTRNIVIVLVAPVVTAFGIFSMFTIMAPLSGCC